MALEAVRYSPALVPEADRLDAWREAISSTHLPWSLQPGDPSGPAARESLVGYRIGDLTVVDCWCGPCAGRRGQAQWAATATDSVGVLFVRAGEEWVEFGGERLVVRPGSALVWRGSDALRFVVPGPLHKWTLMLPASRLPALRSSVLVGGPGVALLTALLGSTLASAAGLDGLLGAAVAEAAVDLLQGVLPDGRTDGDPGAATWLRVSAYVRLYLRDPELSPERMAAAGFVSLRSLYALFSARDETPSRYVRRLRVEAAHRELALAGTRVTVTEVARSWGFRDQATFGRAFRSAYGQTPDEVRRSTAR